MANAEIPFRSEVAKDGRAQGHQVIVTVADSNKGLPDLYWKDKDSHYPGVWIELKWFKDNPFEKRSPVTIPLTALQHQFLQEHQIRGGFAFYAVGWKNKNRSWGAAMGYRLPSDILSQPQSDFLVERIDKQLAGPWDFQTLVRKTIERIDSE